MKNLVVICLVVLLLTTIITTVDGRAELKLWAVSSDGNQEAFDKRDLIPVLPGSISLADICKSAGFTPVTQIGTCYKIITPTWSQASDAKPVAQAQTRCRQLHSSSNLVSIETAAERTILTGLLQQQIQAGQMLDGWQGWWTSGSYQAGVNLFVWRDGSVIANTPANWGFQRTPFLDTCAWVLQIPIYNYTLGNYDCNTSSGYICEINTNTIATRTTS